MTLAGITGETTGGIYGTVGAATGAVRVSEKTTGAVGTVFGAAIAAAVVRETATLVSTLAAVRSSEASALSLIPLGTR